MVISKKQNPPAYSIKLNGTILKQVQKFKYLGAVITSDGKCRTEIRNRIGQAKTTCQRMRNILFNTTLSMNVRKRVLKCYIEPILLYGSESWTIGKSAQKSLEAAEMWFIRRMLRIPWTAKITNEECMRRAGRTKKHCQKDKRETMYFHRTCNEKRGH